MKRMSYLSRSQRMVGQECSSTGVWLSVLIGSGARQIVLMTIDREVLSHEMNSSVFVADARGNTSGPTGQREDGRHSREGQTGRTRRRSAETHRSILATGRAARRMDARV